MSFRGSGISLTALMVGADGLEPSASTLTMKTHHCIIKIIKRNTMNLSDTIIEAVKSLPESKQVEVFDFIEYIKAKKRKLGME